jgi:hypothetical protein
MNVNYDWPVSLCIDAADGHVRVEARLVIPGGSQLVGHGEARRNPADREVALIGAQLATARALSDLVGRLWQAVAAAIEENTHEQALLHT